MHAEKAPASSTTAGPAARSRSPPGAGEPAAKKARMASSELVAASIAATTAQNAFAPEDGSDPAAPASTVGVPPLPSVAHKGRDNGKRTGKKKLRRPPPPEPCSPEDVVAHDVAAVLGEEVVAETLSRGAEWDTPFTFREEVTVEIKALSSNGEGIGIAPAASKPWAILVPFTLPGEVVQARVYRQARLYSFADLLSVDKKNEAIRDDSLVRCRYFGRCAGCQYQMLSYDTQLDLKRNVVVKAYANFSSIPPSQLPPILPTHGSPLQYGYRTKITPHFDAPPKKLQKQKAKNDPPEPGDGVPEDEPWPDFLKIGFNQIGTRHAMDIEECPIATPVINNTLGPVRTGIAKKIYTYKKGVSLLFRDSLEVPASGPLAASAATDLVEESDVMVSEERHVCVTDHRAPVRERVGDMLFEFKGGSFFQNNNSVLVPLVDYVCTAIFGPPPADGAPPTGTTGAPQLTHLVDAYCGSGLFAITLAPSFRTVAGIEISSEAIESANHNAALNAARLPPDTQLSFRAGDAADIFAVVSDFPPDQTAVLIDPPRKGTDKRFIDQLIKLAPRVIVYVSCNVHTQARDVGMMLEKAKESGVEYAFESLRGFDLFPQTAHVESVAVLRRTGIQ